MEGVRARLGDDADERAGAAPVLGRVGVGRDLELLDGIDRGARDLGRQLLHVLRDRVVVHAVEHEVVLERADAVDVGAARAAAGGAAALLRVAVHLHAGDEADEVVPVAARERELLDEVVVDHPAGRRLLRRQERRRGDRDRLGDRADFERGVHARLLPHVELDLFEHDPLEPLPLDRHGVVADGDAGEVVVAGAVGRGRRLDVGRLVLQGHRGVGDDGAGRVRDQARHARAVDLREGVQGEGGEEQQTGGDAGGSSQHIFSWSGRRAARGGKPSSSYSS